MDSDIRDGEPFVPAESDIGRMVAAQLLIRLHALTLGDIIQACEVTMRHEPDRGISAVDLEVKVSLRITHGDYLAIAYPYPLGALQAAENGLADEYRRQQRKLDHVNPTRLGIHPDTVDLWQTEIDESVGRIRESVRR